MSRPTRRTVINMGIDWLYDTAQPDGALLPPGGVKSPTVTTRGQADGPADPDGRYLRFHPTAATGRLPLISVHVAWPQGTVTLSNWITDAEYEQIEAVVAERHQIGASHRDAERLIAYLPLAQPAHPTLVAAADRYDAGCPTHPTTDPEQTLCSLRGCTWFATGYARLVLPDWGPAL